MPSDFWTDLLTRIETRINRHAFQTWFKPTVLVADTGDLVTVRVPNELARNWLTRNYASLIADTAAEARRPGVRVDFVIDADAAAAGPPPAPPAPIPPAAAPGPGPGPAAGQPGSTPAAADPRPAPIPWPGPAPAPTPIGGAGHGLNPRYTFERFVVGPSNQFAHAAALAVSEAPSRSYNPLYIYGGVGLGKTHLMHAIGHQLFGPSPGLRLTYVSSERFMNEMINAVRYDRILEFRERYRNMDVLMIDDVQFLAGKEGTQTEFFHTFNSLYDAQKQIVISSDCPPNEITHLEERLRSRFEWGLIADIQPPDLETKVAILKKKAEAEAVPLADDVALYIATGIKSNIRELEGSLIRLIAYASLTGAAISLPFAREVLRNIVRPDDQPVTIAAVQTFVADQFQLTAADLQSRNSAKAVALPRQIAMYLCKQLTGASLPEIGRGFGGKHHSTVIHSVRKIHERCRTDQEFHTRINNFLDAFR